MDYVGIFGIAAPIILALFGVAYRMGQLNENVKQVQQDMKTVKEDMRGMNNTLAAMPRRRTDREEH